MTLYTSTLTVTVLGLLLSPWNHPRRVENVSTQWVVRRITNTKDNSAPSLSSDGRYVAFYRGNGEMGEYATGYLHLGDLRTGRIRRISQRWTVLQEAGTPVWNRVSNLIYFSAENSVWRFDIRTGRTTRVSPRRVFASCPALSPDERYLAFWSPHSYQQHSYFELWVTDLHSLHSVRLHRYDYRAETEWVWTPPSGVRMERVWLYSHLQALMTDAERICS